MLLLAHQSQAKKSPSHRQTVLVDSSSAEARHGDCCSPLVLPDFSATQTGSAETVDHPVQAQVSTLSSLQMVSCPMLVPMGVVRYLCPVVAARRAVAR